jgi:hypothetical protein
MIPRLQEASDTSLQLLDEHDETKILAVKIYLIIIVIIIQDNKVR